jgi:hypothetical protein
MSALPGPAEAVLAALLAVFVAHAFFGRPPVQADPVSAAAWMLAAILLLAGSALGDGPALVRELLIAGAVVAASEAGWWLRARGDGGDDDDGGEGGPDPGGPPPLDWDEFDRARAGWNRPRELV